MAGSLRRVQRTARSRCGMPQPERSSRRSPDIRARWKRSPILPTAEESCPAHSIRRSKNGFGSSVGIVGLCYGGSNLRGVDGKAGNARSRRSIGKDSYAAARRLRAGSAVCNFSSFVAIPRQRLAESNSIIRKKRRMGRTHHRTMPMVWAEIHSGTAGAECSSEHCRKLQFISSPV